MNKLEHTDPLTNGCIIRKNDNFTIHANNDKHNGIILNDIYEKFFCIEDINKPIKPIASYTAVELMDICIRLDLPHTSNINDKIKPLTKPVLYDNIKQYMIKNYFMTAKLN